ncbi:5-(carboxyamino)imidazole ribonucleotide synthase [Sphingomonas sp. ASV193]|uniref:5-(carboxyamino)imidazole ribonucleotide synthase n=1 Tax=Sphingomonas sp. ASV193 TaxID=3144405 RepID=UPI0032E8EA6E
MIEPGATIGIVGGGQLGRMLAIAAAQLGYRCHVFDPHEAPCAAEVAAKHTRAAFDDQAALKAFAADCAVVTYEFENLPSAPLGVIDAAIRPSRRSLEVSQDRAEEKAFLESAGARVAPWRTVDSAADARAAFEALGGPVLLKTRRMGYDGKGQAWLSAADEAETAHEAIGRQPAVAEAKVAFDAEFSVIVGRGPDGATAAFPVPRNEHRDGILRHSIVPAGPLVAPHEAEAVRLATGIAAALDHVGVITIEFFACADGPLVNEFAPRVHNSGHWTIEGAETSQFEQHVRAICGLPLGPTGLTGARVVMDNLIGRDVEAWPALIAEPGAHLHLYGKGEARDGRKMGHVTRVSRRA